MTLHRGRGAADNDHFRCCTAIASSRSRYWLISWSLLVNLLDVTGNIRVTVHGKGIYPLHSYQSDHYMHGSL